VRLGEPFLQIFEDGDRLADDQVAVLKDRNLAERVQATELRAAMGPAVDVDLHLFVRLLFSRSRMRTRRGMIEKGCQWRRIIGGGLIWVQVSRSCPTTQARPSRTYKSPRVASGSWRACRGRGSPAAAGQPLVDHRQAVPAPERLAVDEHPR
jgi:hypothetical protein